MPILHRQFQRRTTAPDGSVVAIPPPIVLVQQGPCIQVTVSTSQVIATQLLQQGLPLPLPESGLGLIDTGASVTCIDDTVAQRMGLPVVDVVRIASASHASSLQRVYPAHIELVGTNIEVDADRVVGAALGPQGLLLLIGRDVLQNCTLFYNGLSGQITLSV